MRDIVGACLSVVCMIHCFLPLLALSVGASFGIHQVAEHMHHEWMHLGLLFPIILLLAYSLPTSYLQHRDIKPALLAFTGLFILLAALVVGGHLETPITIVGSMFVIAAHLYNRRKIKFTPA